MISSEGTEALIALEDAGPDVLFESLPDSGARIWPLLRWPVARSMAEIELNTIAVRGVSSRRKAIVRAARQVIPSPYHSARIRRDKDFMFVVDGGTSRLTPTGRANWLVDDFANAVAGRSVVLQDLDIDRSAVAQRPDFDDTFTFIDSLTYVDGATKIAPLGDEAKDFVRSVVRETFRQLPFDVDAARSAAVEDEVVYRCARIRHLNRRFEKTLDRVHPKAVFMQTGAYGDRSSLISILKKRGILVAEPQHGWIGPCHAAYNFGAAMSTPELQACLPDVLLTFGDFWSSIVRYPGEIVSIGKPHIDASASASVADRPLEVVVVSSVYARDTIVRYTRVLRDHLPPSWKVVFRPHPSERASATEIYSELVGESRIEFDDRADVYETLSTVRGVFGFASTVLYEALAFGCHVSVFDSPLADLYIDDAIFGERVSDERSLQRAAAGLVDSSGHGDTGISPTVLEQIWKPNATENFRRFVEDRVK